LLAICCRVDVVVYIHHGLARWIATRWIDEARSTLLTRVARARHVLEKGRALIVFDSESQKCMPMLKGAGAEGTTG
jgi:hypothetical protein